MIFSALFIATVIIYNVFTNHTVSILSSKVNLIKEGTIEDIAALWKTSELNDIMISLAFLFFTSSAALSLMTLPGIVGGLLLAIITMLILRVYDARLAAAAIMVGSFTTSLLFDSIYLLNDAANKFRALTESKRAHRKQAVFQSKSLQSNKGFSH